MTTNEGTAISMSPVRAGFHPGENEDFQDNQQRAGITAHPSPPCTTKLVQHHFAHSGSTSAVRRETRRLSIEGSSLAPGATIGDEVPFELVKPLGQGAFSSVWLARDLEDRLLPSLARSASKKQRQKRRKSASMAKKLEEYVRGIKPSVKVDGLAGSGPGVLDEMDGKGACWPDSPVASRSNSMTSKEPDCKPGRLVAVKMMDRSLCDTNDRTRISFVREVEVLRVRYCKQFLLFVSRN
jgi:serine/threonine protein kinase